MAIVKEFEENSRMAEAKLKQLDDACMHAGLTSAGGSKIKMLISFVDNLPTGLCYAWASQGLWQ
ncbi:hypothetical protein ACS0TY_011437 [Phlomoides rotata]